MESALYGIYALVFVSEILLVRCAHSFDFWYVNNSYVNTVRQHFPWSILYIWLHWHLKTALVSLKSESLGTLQKHWQTKTSYFRLDHNEDRKLLCSHFKNVICLIVFLRFIQVVVVMSLQLKMTTQAAWSLVLSVLSICVNLALDCLLSVVK